MRRALYKILLSLALILVLSFVVGGIYLCETTIHLPRRRLTDDERTRAQALAQSFNGTLETAAISSGDGVTLSGWFFRLNPNNDRVVLLLHGQGDQRAGMLPYAQLFLRHQYNVLIPDMRAHGESGGSLATYGLKEADDVHAWVSWLVEKQRPAHIFGLGESMGAAIILQALRSEPRFAAVVAESSFASFREICYDRTGQWVGAGSAWGRTFFRPWLETAFLYARLRYGEDFNRASPAEVVAGSAGPVLLIHGLEDQIILPYHSRRILQRKSGPVELWEVPKSGHSVTITSYPAEFEPRVCGWFDAAVARREEIEQYIRENR